MTVTQMIRAIAEQSPAERTSWTASELRRAIELGYRPGNPPSGGLVHQELRRLDKYRAIPQGWVLVAGPLRIERAER